jgi:hypothetical protein
VERENIVHSAFIFFSGMLTLDPWNNIGRVSSLYNTTHSVFFFYT